MQTLIAPRRTGGSHDLTAAVANTLAAQDMLNPHTGQPLSEAMILGIGGGLGAGYILWEFKAYEIAIIVMGFRNRWNYAVDYLTNTCQRLSVKPHFAETTGQKTAQANLEEALAHGVPVITWVDKAHMPHQQLPAWLDGMSSHIVTVYGLDSGCVLVDDLADDLIEVDLEPFQAGRGRVSSDKNRLLRLEPTGALDLPAAIRAGIDDCIAHLSRDSESFSLPVYQKWAKMMTHTKNKKGWPVVFKDRHGLYSTLGTVYEGIALQCGDGHALRSLYADFLGEAAAVLDHSPLQQASDHYRQAAKAWEGLANSVLASDPLRESKRLMDQRYALYKARDWAAMRQVNDQRQALSAEYDHAFPMDDAEVAALFETMQTHLEDIYAAETQALESLKAAAS